MLLGLSGTTALATAGTGDVLSGHDRGHGRPRRGPLEAAALAAHVHGRAGARGPVEGPGGRRPARPGGRGALRDAAARTARGARPWLTAGARPGPTSTSMPCATTPRSWPAWPARPRCARWSRPTATGTARCRWPGPRWRGAPLAGRGPGRGGGGPPRGRASRRRSCCSPSRRSEAMAEAVARRLVPTVYTDGGARTPRRRGGRRRPGRRSTVHLKVDTGMHRVGADPADVPDLAGRHRRRSPAGLRRRCGPTWPWPTGPSPADRELHRRPARAVRRRAGRPGRRRAPAPDDPRGQLGRRHRRPGGPARPGPLRHRRLRRGPDPGPGRPSSPRPPGADGSGRCSRCGPGSPRPRPRGRGAPLLRPAPGRWTGARRWPPRPSATPTASPAASSTRAARC